MKDPRFKVQARVLGGRKRTSRCVGARKCGGSGTVLRPPQAALVLALQEPLIHLLHVAVRRGRALGGGGVEVRGHLGGQSGRAFGIQVCGEQGLAGSLENKPAFSVSEEQREHGAKGTTNTFSSKGRFIVASFQQHSGRTSVNYCQELVTAS